MFKRTAIHFFSILVIIVFSMLVRVTQASEIRADIREIINISDKVIIGTIQKRNSVLATDGSTYSEVSLLNAREITSSGLESLNEFRLTRPGGTVEVTKGGERFLRGTDIPANARFVNNERVMVFLVKLVYGYDLTSQSQGIVRIKDDATLLDSSGRRIIGLVKTPGNNPPHDGLLLFDKEVDCTYSEELLQRSLLEYSGDIPDTPQSGRILGIRIENEEVDDLEGMIGFVIKTLKGKNEDFNEK